MSAASTASAPARAGAGRLQVGGLTPFTTIDFPGRLSAVVFVQGCPWRCGYCHNPHLQARAGARGPDWTEVLGFLARRIGLLDGVVFSGGEPTLDPALGAAIRDVKALGLAVGLHTAGIYPRRLAQVLPLVDWVGLDIKAPLDDPSLHDRITDSAGCAAPVRRSLRAVLASGIAHEFRTTAHPALLADADLLRIGAALAQEGGTDYVVQVYRKPAPGFLLDGVADDYPAAPTLLRLRDLFERFTLRRG